MHSKWADISSLMGSSLQGEKTLSSLRKTLLRATQCMCACVCYRVPPAQTSLSPSLEVPAWAFLQRNMAPVMVCILATREKSLQLPNVSQSEQINKAEFVGKLKNNWNTQSQETQWWRWILSSLLKWRIAKCFKYFTVICLFQWEDSPAWRNTGAPLNSTSVALYVLVRAVWWAGGKLRIPSCFLNTLFSSTDSSQDRTSLSSLLGSAALAHDSVGVSIGIHHVVKLLQHDLANFEEPRIFFWTPLDFWPPR